MVSGCKQLCPEACWTRAGKLATEECPTDAEHTPTMVKISQRTPKRHYVEFE